MKKYIRKLSALFMCAILVFSMAIMASASTVSWSDSEGGKTLSLTVTGTSSVKKAINGAPVIYHVKGTATTIPASGAYSVTQSATRSGAIGSYLTYLQQAMSAEGMKMSYTASGSSTPARTIAAALATGNYTLGVSFTCKNGSWGINSGILPANTNMQPRSVIASGTVTNAPTGSATIVVIPA